MRALSYIRFVINMVIPMSVAYLGLASARAAAAPVESPTWSEISNPPPPAVYKVTQYMDLAAGSNSAGNLVLLGAGSNDGIVPGTVMKTYRSSPQVRPNGALASLWVETGRLKVVEVQENFTVAAVEAQGSAMSAAFFPKFPGVMAGDLAAPQRLTLSRRQTVMPTVTMSYFDLFEDPKATPTSFELTAEGLARLRAEAKVFGEARMTMLMVEGYTDHNGSASANQVESYQRALTVRQFLVDELGFDPKRVVAIGFGGDEPADPSYVAGYVEANRRIVLKAVQMPPAAPEIHP
jgi:outer membrane protein OmpA-like peptidoglycan-associated protein